jgi:hypothetical protein
LTRRGACAWFHEVWTCGVKVLEYWMIFSLKIKLNSSWKAPRIWCEASWLGQSHNYKTKQTSFLHRYICNVLGIC